MHQSASKAATPCAALHITLLQFATAICRSQGVCTCPCKPRTPVTSTRQPAGFKPRVNCPVHAVATLLLVLCMHCRHVLVAICSAGLVAPGVTSAPPQGSQQQHQEQQQAASSSHAAFNAAPISSCSCSHAKQHGRPHAISSQDSQPTAWRHAPQQQHHQHVSRQRDSQQQRHRQPLQPQLQLLSDGPDRGSSSQRKPEPPTTSGAPPPDAAGSGSNAGNSGSSGSNGSSQPAAGSTSVDDEVDQALEKVWASLKRDLKKELPPEQVRSAAQCILQ
jgi:hypothetical protein